MGRWTFVFMFVVLYASAEDMFDITTILRYEEMSDITQGNNSMVSHFEQLCTVTIHARNNAFGLPIRLYNGSVIDANVGVEIKTCNSNYEKCDWEANNFTLTPVGDNLPLLVPDTVKKMKFYCSNCITPSFSLRNNFEINFETPVFDGILGIFLTQENDDLYEEDMYYVHLTNKRGYNEDSVLLKCVADSGGTEYALPSNLGYRYCDVVSYMNSVRNYGFNIVHGDSTKRYTFKLIVSHDKIDLYEVLESPILLCSWKDSYPIDVKRISLGTMRTSGEFTVDVSDPVSWTLSESKGSLVSPSFVPSYNKVCVSVTYKKNEESSIGLTGIQQEQNVEFVHIQTTNMIGGWKTTIFLAELPDDMAREPMAVQLTAKSCNITDLMVQRIAGCNSKGSTDTFLLKEVRDFIQLPVYGYDVAVAKETNDNDRNYVTTEEPFSFHSTTELEDLEDNIFPHSFMDTMIHNAEVKETGTNSFSFDYWKLDATEHDVTTTESTDLLEWRKCMSGGFYNEQQNLCVCPVGFIGSKCQTGCGTNKYGLKCDGHCSKTTRGCKGMKLCAPNQKCTCAPGLQGYNCDMECIAGKYGNGCKQVCGECNYNESCDPYTGICLHGCKASYYPPYCKENYAYLLESPEVIHVGFDHITVRINLISMNIYGGGIPIFYQLQYKIPSHVDWTELEPQPLTHYEVDANITNLHHATLYQLRTVLLINDGESYQGPKIPVKEVATKCSVPDNPIYNLHILDTAENYFQVSWSYTPDSHLSCPVSYFEIELYEEWDWVLHFKGSETFAKFNNLLPGQQYEVHMRVVTFDGAAPFSDVLVVCTKDEGPEKVFNFQLVSSKYNELEVKWMPPLETAGTIRQYKVSYQCQKLLACNKHNCSYSNGQFETTTTTAVLHNLLPHAQYSISVAALAGSWGPATQLLAVTDMTAPAVPPDPSSSTAITQKTNSSFTIQWEPPQNCTLLNGYLHGYRYGLLDQNNFVPNIEVGTELTSATFTNLISNRNYTVWVFLVTSGGWSFHHPLILSANTRATVPSHVENLTVFETGRRTLSARWAAPKSKFGDLKSFTLSFKANNQTVKEVAKPTLCVPWPHLYCHTSEILQPDTEYTVVVQARNKDVDEDGDPAIVTAITKERAPSAPSFVRVASQTQTDLNIEWGLPDMLNGKLQSFIINMQQTDSFNSSDCCQYFPIQEILVSSEQAQYNYQVSSLRPAATYAISVTAKTVALGPSVIFSAHTRPPVPSMDGMIEIPHKSRTPTVMIHPSTENKELIRGYLLLVLPQSSEENIRQTSIWNEWLALELNKYVNNTFYLAAEFRQGELDESSEIVLGTKSILKTGRWGEIQNPNLQVGKKYCIGLVLILDYCGILNMGYTQTDPFLIE